MQTVFACQTLIKETSMSTTTFSIPALHRYAIGFDQIINELNQNFNDTTYPPYNIVQQDDRHYAVELAIAGFSLDNLSIELIDGKLIVNGEQSKEELPIIYLHKGISTRTFSRTFTLATNVEVQTAAIKNGILTIHLEQLVPAEQYSKKIEITDTSTRITPKRQQHGQY